MIEKIFAFCMLFFCPILLQAQVALSWAASGTSGVTYNVYRLATSCPTGDTGFTQIITGLSSVAFTDSSVSAGVTYCYYVTASDAGGESAPSNSIQETIPQDNGATINIGETTVLSAPDNGNGNLLLAQSAILSEAAQLQSLSFYVTQAAGDLMLGVYDSTGPNGGPGNLIAQTAQFTPIQGWNTANTTIQPMLTPGTYWLAYAPTSNALAFLQQLTTGMPAYYYYYRRWYRGALPAQFSDSPVVANSVWSFYATLVVP